MNKIRSHLSVCQGLGCSCVSICKDLKTCAVKKQPEAIIPDREMKKLKNIMIIVSIIVPRTVSSKMVRYSTSERKAVLKLLFPIHLKDLFIHL